MKKLFNKKWLLIMLIVICVITIFISVFVITKFSKIDVVFSLKGDNNITIEIGSSYLEPGYVLNVNGKEQIADINNYIDEKVVGKYQVKYLYKDKRKHVHELVRNVFVVDTVKPEITLKGNNVVYLYVGNKYEDDGFIATDNYDGDITDKVEIQNNIDINKVGCYEIKYIIKDSSGNEESTSRTVNVIAKKVIQKTESKGNVVSKSINTIVSKNDNTIVENKFNDNNIYIKGYLKNSGNNVVIRAKGNTIIDFNMIVSNDTYYGNIDVSKLDNGKYDLYVVTNDEIKLQNKMDSINRIERAKVNDKLVTFSYDNDNVSILVEDFMYQYDILIDVGHGGSDVGASNGFVYEKDMNLIVSKYEKCRYEEHGLKVLLNRTDDSYGLMMGDNSWVSLVKRGYALGYYGVVSKIVYSNHHNSTTNSSKRGYEIITPTQYNSLDTEKSIASRFNGYYGLSESASRFYTRDYNSGQILTTLYGNKYDVKIYYCVVRVPYELFNTKVVIYEPIFISNYEDYSWYWLNEKWKEVSEIKISEYVKSLGIEYKSNINC